MSAVASQNAIRILRNIVGIFGEKILRLKGVGNVD
jgi:hypothetical protein